MRRNMCLAHRTRHIKKLVREKLFGPPIKKKSPQPPLPEKSQAISNWQKILDNLIALTKGKVDVKTGEWFYRLFTSKNTKLTSIEEARSYLEEAYWIEEEDIEQEIYRIIWQYKLTYRWGYWLKYNLARHIKDWILQKQKPFRRLDKETYSCYMIQQPEDPPDKFYIVLDPPDNIKTLTLYDRYLLYLDQERCLQQEETGNILLTSARQIRRNLEDIDARNISK
jgi:hypothetical protein